jgi:UDPglucose--hexose-1-phosphate uridylyltransferase
VSSEVPAPDYDVVVFENRFPSLSDVHCATGDIASSGGFVSAPGMGHCEVVAFSSNHTGSFADLDEPHARLVVEAWRHRTAELMTRPGIEQVFCFENRGEEIGVTLTHPHGQIYGFPHLTPRTTTMLAQARAHRVRHGTNLFASILADEISDGRRIIAHDDAFTAFVPFASRWPVEVHIYPNRFVRSLIELDDAELDSFARMYLDVLRRFDRLYTAPLPYMSALHQYADDDGQREGYFHVELLSTRRSATKLKYLASAESAMEAFINDTTPETVADRLREL